ncbi:MAG: ABC transporter permease [Clostridiales bacterium]|nr:ABC transporter permease [Clostridiales bacterium]
MTKEKLLAGSHFRKNKGSSIGIFLLMLLASALLSLAMILFTDTYPTATNEAKRLDAGDGQITLTSALIDETDPDLQELLRANTARYDVVNALDIRNTMVPFTSGEVMVRMQIETLDTISKKKMARTEILEEDTSITSDYIYVPYQFKTTGSFAVGDDYALTILGVKYHFKIRGFLNTVYGGCNNGGVFEMVVSPETYEKILAQCGEYGESRIITYKLKDDVKPSVFRIRTSNTLKSLDPWAEVKLEPIDQVMSGRTFMSLIIAGSFLAVTLIVMLVIVLMIVNSISNYIKENMKTIGVLKAIGYTGNNIKLSLLLMFLSLALIASVLGIGASYLFAGPIASFVIAQMGVPYTVSFSVIGTIVAFSTVVLSTAVFTLLSLRKINKIQPIVALREGAESHNFKSNPIKLDKSFLGLNSSLSMKTMLHNKRQNIITFFVTGFLIFLCVIALLMFENFNRKPNLKLLANETCDGMLSFDKDTKEEGEVFLASQEGVHNIRRCYNDTLYVGDENSLWLEAYDDPMRKNNPDICYKGRLPQHDNEINISGLFCKNEGYEIGDEIEITLGDKSYTYLITGFIQTTNNGGGECVLSEAGYAHLTDLSSKIAYYYFDTDKEEQVNPALDACKEKFGEGVISTANFRDVIEANMATFRGISTLMLVMVATISGLVILLVLFLLIRSLIFSKRKDYGIYKAIGYTSRSLIFQTAGSFMPAIILSVIVFSVVSYVMANPYMELIMINFGLMKCTFSIPIPGVIIIGASMIILSFLFAVFESRRIKKVEPYKMLVAE